MVEIYRKVKRWINFRFHGSKTPWLQRVNAGSPSAVEEIFTNIYRQNAWEDSETISGAGSNLRQTRVLRQRLPGLLKELNVATMLDIPCGDYYWLSKTKLDLAAYLGADIVKNLVTANQIRYARNVPAVSFVALDLLSAMLPRHDLILCRDCLVHFSNQDVRQALRQIKRSGSTYLLTTSFPPPRTNDKDIRTGEWRPLNLEAAPFNLPRPQLRILEGLSECRSRFTDKTLAVSAHRGLAGVVSVSCG